MNGENISISSSSSSATSSATTDALYSYVLWLEFEVVGFLRCYFLGPAIFVNLVNNGLIVLVFATSSGVRRETTASLRVYYVAMALADITSSLANHFMYFISDGLFYGSGGRFYFYLDQVSLAVCKTRGFFHFVSEAFGEWILVALVLERLVALRFPFAIKKWSNGRNALLLCFGVLVWCVGLTIPALIHYGIYSTSVTRDNKACLSLSSDPFESATISWISDAGAKIYAVVIMTFLTLLLAVELAAITRHRRKLVALQSEDSAGGGSRESRVAVLIIALCLVNCVFYIPYGCAIAIFVLSLGVPGFLPSASLLFLALFDLFTCFTIVMKLWNFYLYFMRVPAFRQQVLTLVGLADVVKCTESTHSRHSVGI